MVTPGWHPTRGEGTVFKLLCRLWSGRDRPLLADSSRHSALCDPFSRQRSPSGFLQVTCLSHRRALPPRLSITVPRACLPLASANFLTLSHEHWSRAPPLTPTSERRGTLQSVSPPTRRAMFSSKRWTRLREQLTNAVRRHS